MQNRSKKGDVSRLRILHAIYAYAQAQGRSPSYREVSKLTGLKSNATIARHVGILQETGYLQKQNQGEPRSLVLTVKGKKTVEDGQL